MELDGSLFEGMTLFTSSSSSADPTPPTPPLEAQSQSQPHPLPPPTPPESQSQTQSEPLDEDLFSDLTLQVPSPSVSQAQSVTPPESPSPSSNRMLRQQVSIRKKKRAVRIGYARDAVSLDDEPHLPSSSSFSSSSAPPPSTSSSLSSTHIDDLSNSIPNFSVQPEMKEKDQAAELESEPEMNEKDQAAELESDPKMKEAEQAAELESELMINEDSDSQINKEEECAVVADSTMVTISEKLLAMRDEISGKVESSRERAAAVTRKRKELGSKGRKVREEVKEASARYAELERELEEACESEDFERAERISDSLAAVERDKNQLLLDLRSAELDYDALDSDMESVLRFHLAAHQQAVSLLLQFSKDASDYADLVRKNAEEKASKEVEEWESSMELLETKKMEMDVECELIGEAESGLQSRIDKLVEHDRREKEMLSTKREILAKELADLLELVRLKEQEIALNDAQMHEIDRRISDVASEFHETESSIKRKLDDLQAAQSELASESESLAMKKKEIDDFILSWDERRSKLAEIASVCSVEAKRCEDLVQVQRDSAASITKRRLDRIHFAKLEESISEDVQSLKQQVADARAALQELASRRGCLEEEIVVVKQRTSYIEKRVPELEAEKKVAAAARNFKEAARIAAEAKALTAERDELRDKQEKACAELEKVEQEMRSTGERIDEWEGLILVKEKEGATASFERLRLVAAAARAERAAALQAGDEEEGELLLAEAQAAECKAAELNQTYQLHHHIQEMEEEEEANQQQSAAFIINSSAHHLARLASSFTLDPLT
ncbi:hypothetical protein LUZ60_003412 [Juncus effusus]|nr:hypothetical protein LUZ60_003412 [Juncus effusus]